MARRPLFDGDGDRRLFLAEVSRQVREGRIRLHAYCLMANHYHLLVEVPEADLSAAMREIGHRYSRAFNRARGRDGPLFRDRFSSRMLSDEAYRQTVLSYIDANPVEAGIARASWEYEWGSAKAFDSGRVPPWLATGWVERVTLLRTEIAGLPPGTYRNLFSSGGSEGRSGLVESRLFRRRSHEPIDPAVRLEQLESWLRRRAEQADGRGAWLPLAGAKAVLAAVLAARTRRGAWEAPRPRHVRDRWGVATVALLRDLVGHSHRRIGVLQGLSDSAVRARLELHRRWMATDGSYVARINEIARDCLLRSWVLP